MQSRLRRPNTGETVGQVPKKISKICSSFLQHGGLITAVVIQDRHNHVLHCRKYTTISKILHRKFLAKLNVANEAIRKIKILAVLTRYTV